MYIDGQVNAKQYTLVFDLVGENFRLLEAQVNAKQFQSILGPENIVDNNLCFCSKKSDCYFTSYVAYCVIKIILYIDLCLIVLLCNILTILLCRVIIVLL